MTRERRAASTLLTGEWACLALLSQSPMHGFALSKELSPTGDIGRIWSLSRPLTYRAIDQLLERGYVEPRGEQPGRAGGNRTIYSATRSGRSAFRSWVVTPVAHPRDLRSELLLKIALARRCSISTDDLIRQQREIFEDIRVGLVERLHGEPDDVVLMWRIHSVRAALRFLDDLDAPTRRKRALT